MTAIRRNTYADRAHAFRSSADRAREAGDLARATDLEEMAARCETAHETRPWRTAEDLRYDSEDCCTECQERQSDPHGPTCLYADMSYATA